MSSNGTLTYYDEKNKIFKTVYIHHIENNYSDEIDSLALLNRHYKTSEDAENLVKNGFLSHFNKDEIIKGSEEDCIVSDSILDLQKLTSDWTLSNYVYFFGYWYPSPFDVENIYFKNSDFYHHYEETSYYDLVIRTCEFFISKPSQTQNINVSKIVIVEKNDIPDLVLCMTRRDIVATSSTNQIADIYDNITQRQPVFKDAKWFDFNPEPIYPFLEYQLAKVNFENDSPSWEKFISWHDLANHYNIEGFGDFLQSIATK